MDGLDLDGLTFLENRRMERVCPSVPSMVIYQIWADTAKFSQ